MGDAIVSMNQKILGKLMTNIVCFNNMEEEADFLTDFADKIRDSWDFSMQSHMSDEWSLDDLTVSFLLNDTVDYSVTVPFTAGPLVGASNGEVLPTQSALLCSMHHIGSAPNRGRIYFGGYVETAQSNSIWSLGARGDAIEMVNGWKDGITVLQSSVFLRILRRPSGVFPSYVSNPVSLVGSTAPIRTIRNRALPN